MPNPLNQTSGSRDPEGACLIDHQIVDPIDRQPALATFAMKTAVVDILGLLLCLGLKGENPGAFGRNPKPALSIGGHGADIAVAMFGAQVG